MKNWQCWYLDIAKVIRLGLKRIINRFQVANVELKKYVILVWTHLYSIHFGHCYVWISSYDYIIFQESAYQETLSEADKLVDSLNTNYTNTIRLANSLNNNYTNTMGMLMGMVDCLNS